MMKKQPTEEEIKVAAYYIWQSEGCPNNSDFGDWMRAQEDLCKCFEGKEHWVCKENTCCCSSKKEPVAKKAATKKTKK